MSTRSSMTAARALFLVCVFHCIVTGRMALPRKFPALIIFGDSVVDTGNNDYIKTIAKCNFPPYGRDFPKGATGRCSNGKVPSDLFGVRLGKIESASSLEPKGSIYHCITSANDKYETYLRAAEALGIKEYVPPYLDPTLGTDDLVTGVCFASGGAGYDPESAQIAEALTLTDQLKLFEEYKTKLRDAIGENRTESIVSDSAYLIVVGSNDLTNTYFGLPIRRLQYDINSYTDYIANSASTFVQDLYNAGARNVAILSAPPSGCLPSQRTLAGGLERECVAEYNNAALLFNSKLESAIRLLSSRLPGAALVYLDIYAPLLDLVNNPTKAGFEVSDRGCCGTGKIEATFLCNPYSPGTCPDADKYVFWDAYHPSQRGYEVLLKELFNKYPGFLR